MDDYESDEYAPIDELFGAGSQDETLFTDQQIGPALFDLEPEEPAGLFDLPQDGPDLFGKLPDTSRAKAISAAIRPSLKDEPADPTTSPVEQANPAAAKAVEQAETNPKPSPKRRRSKAGTKTLAAPEPATEVSGKDTSGRTKAAMAKAEQPVQEPRSKQAPDEQPEVAPVQAEQQQSAAEVVPEPVSENEADTASEPAMEVAAVPVSELAATEEVPLTEPQQVAVELDTPSKPKVVETSPTITDQPAAKAPTRTEKSGDFAAPLALYRRYRPDTFADVIGQEHVTDPLQRALINGKVNHAYLFSGPRGCGKTSSARILARCLNCVEGPTPTPCGKCRSCTDLARTGPGSIDVIEIDAASHGGVDDARDLRERAFFAPVHSRYKIYIIDEAHMVTTAGFNALLKLVEEPPPHVKFIFATTEPEKVIGTIRSRTHHYPFRLVPPKVLTDYLAKLCHSEGVDVDSTVLPLVVRAGAGSVRDSLSILDQLLGAADVSGVRYSQAAALLGYTPDTLLDEVVDAIAAGDASAVFATIDKVIEVGQDPRRFAEDLLRRLRDLIIVSAVPDAVATGLIDVAADQAQRFATQVAGIGRGELTRSAEVLASGLTEMRGTTAPRLHLELMCARILLPGADDKERGLHARLDRLERRIGMIQGPGPAPQSTDTPAQHVQTREPATQPSHSGTAAQRPPAQPQKRPAGGPESASTQAAPSPPQEQGFTASTGQRPSASEQMGGQQATSPVRPPAEPGFTQRPAGQRPPEQDRGQRPSTQAGQQRGWENEPTSTQPTQPANQQASTGSAPVGQLSAVELRRIWPAILDRLKGRRRYTWMVVSQNAQVLDMTNGKLTLGFSNTGARDSFSQRGGVEDLGAVLAEEIGVSPHIIAVHAEGGPDIGPRQRPVGAPAESVTSPAAQANTPEPQPEEQISDEDDEIIDQALSVEELLATQLGAEVIHEENGQ